MVIAPYVDDWQTSSSKQKAKYRAVGEFIAARILRRLKRAGIISSESVESEDGFCKKYSINKNGEDLVSKYMRKESLQFE